MQTILMPIAAMPYHRSVWIFYIGLANLGGKNMCISLRLDVEICARNYKEIVRGQ